MSALATAGAWALPATTAADGNAESSAWAFSLQAVLRPLTGGSELPISAATLGSLAVFQPIRRRIQDAVNLRFDRARYDAARTPDAFADRLQDEIDLDALRAELLAAVDQTMSPVHASLWLQRAR